MKARLLSSHFRILTSLGLLLLAFVLCWSIGLDSYAWILFSPRPLFHESGLWEKPVWYPILPITDECGNKAYFDLDKNVIVVIVADDSSPVRLQKARPTSAVFTIGETKSHVVTPQNNNVVFVDPGICTVELTLSPGSAHAWYTTLNELYKSGHPPKLIDYIAQQYDNYGSLEGRKSLTDAGFIKKE